MLLQRRLSELLQDCVGEIDAARPREDRTAHGFRRGRSIITNAREHRHRRWVFNVDLEDFFPSINFGRVRGFLLRDRDFALREATATVVAQIACHENSLPQGSPCSPVISNLVAHLLDMRLVKLASASGCTYSRYADDLTFSTNKKGFPADIAVPSGDECAPSRLWLPGAALQRAIERSGFHVNAEKTRQMHRTSRQRVTGLVVNKKVNVRCEYRRNVRAMVHRLVKTGAFQVLGVTQSDGQAILGERSGTLSELHGMLGFIHSIEAYNRPNAPGASPEGRSSNERVYREFLVYSTFFAAKSPVVICEGDTDNVYLTHAIRSLSAAFPALAETAGNGGVRLKLRLYKYPKSSTARLLGLESGGSSVLAKFIGAYGRETRRFERPGPTEPVIVLYDNDDGARPVRTVIKKVSKADVDPSEPFVHIIENLYAVPTPPGPGGAKSRIEDFFDAQVKATKVDGKTFNPSDGFDRDKHYGKKVFAHKVVRPNADRIDFSAFGPLLTSVTAAINRHRALVAP